MTLDPRFFIAPSLEMYFVDKDTGEPLSGGIVTFYSDTNRTVLKPVYEYNSATTPNYIPINNPVILSDVGTFQDESGANILPFYYPYTGTPTEDTGIVELYYITVYSSGGILQFTREAWPPYGNIGPTPSSESEYYNYIPNGQFLTHNNPPYALPLTAGTTAIAPGGWFYKTPSGSSTSDTVTFTVLTPTANPTGNSKFKCTIQCVSPNPSDLFKDLVLQFQDVNKFASNTATIEYTFAFTARTETGTNQPVEILIQQNFGTGGSATVETPITASVTITPTFTIYQYVFSFPTTIGKTIGTIGTDFVALIIRFPDNAFTISVTDFILAYGTLEIESFQDETNSDMLDRSVFGSIPIPDPNGYSLYLPVIYTQTGATFDMSVVGSITTLSYPTGSTPYAAIPPGYLACDGAQYYTFGYNSLGIPYQRLFNSLIDVTSGIPRWGTGLNYATVTINNSSNFLFLENNLPGVTTATADGAIPTNITFTTITPGTYIGLSSYISSNSPGLLSVTIADTNYLAYGPVVAGNSGFTVGQVSLGSTITKQQFQVSTTVLPTAGHYFAFANGATSSNVYYIWYTINGAGTDPAPGGTGIKVSLLSTMTATDTNIATTAAIAGKQVTLMSNIPAGSAITAGSYFTFTTVPTNLYTVWFSVNNVGTKPSVSGTVIYIEVSILSSFTVSQVAAAILNAINSQYFATPDLRGVFLRGWNNGSGNDPEAALRFTLTNNYTLAGDQVGTYQQDQFANHTHPSTTNTSGVIQELGTGYQIINSAPSGSIELAALNLSYTGGYETRPLNAYVNFIIHM